MTILKKTKSKCNLFSCSIDYITNFFLLQHYIYNYKVKFEVLLCSHNIVSFV